MQYINCLVHRDDCNAELKSVCCTAHWRKLWKNAGLTIITLH